MSARNWGLLVLLALLWGSSFYFYKVLIAVLPPVTVVLGRVGIAAIALNLWLWAQGQALPLKDGMWLRFLWLGFLNNVVCFVLIAWSETRITSGMASILNGTTPIFMVLVAHWLTHDDKMSVNKVTGILFGFAGTLVLVGPDALAGGGELLGELAVIAASCLYAFAAVYSRRFTGLSALVAATGQVTGATAILLPLSLLFDRPWTLAMPGADIWASLLFIALMNTAAAYWVYYKMLATTGVTYISLVTFLIPPVALLLGAVFLHESITLHALIGMAIIALGLLAVDGRLPARLRPPSIPRP
ncbi:MAG TPA: DMT family transporter [Rhizomicrobium sp.]|nr:DMT family transporter [Rhizomicrobium sp.]